MDDAAQTWAAGQRPGTALRWKELEVAAWAPYPSVHRLLAGRGSGVPRSVAVLGALLAVIVMTAWLYPVAGYAVAAGGRFGTAGTPETRVHVSGWIFTAGVVLHAAGLALWAATNRTRQYVFQLQGAAAVVLGALTLWLYAGLRDDVPDTTTWVVPVLASVALGAVTLVAHGRAPLPVRTTEPRQAARAAIARLTEDQRTAVRRDLGAALDDLRERGVITATEHRRTRDADLGLLTVAVSTRTTGEQTTDRARP